MKKSKLARLIAAICCFAMLLTACSSNQTPAESGGDGSTTADSEKKVLTYAIGAETTDLSTLYMNNSLYCTSKLVYENLVDFDNGEIVPGLAESWEYNDDQTELTFHLRQGVTFHNGEPFNAEAVKTNLEHKQSNPSFYSLKGIILFYANIASSSLSVNILDCFSKLLTHSRNASLFTVFNAVSLYTSVITQCSCWIRSTAESCA